MKTYRNSLEINRLYAAGVEEGGRGGGGLYLIGLSDIWLLDKTDNFFCEENFFVRKILCTKNYVFGIFKYCKS